MAKRKAAAVKPKKSVKKTGRAKRAKKKVVPKKKVATRPSAPRVNETIEAKKKRAGRLLTALKKVYPEADCALTHHDPFQLIIATILSAQSTDDTVNKVTPVLFAKYPTPRALADAPREDVEAIVHPTGFFRQKAKSIQGTAAAVADQFDGRVPKTIEELTSLPGVARKTANVVLGTAFGINEGVVVDTHIGRLATRLALTWTSKNDKDAVKIERDLMEIIPQKEWTYIGHALIWHGRKVCSARKPNCINCTLAKNCPSAGTFEA